MSIYVSILKWSLNIIVLLLFSTQIFAQNSSTRLSNSLKIYEEKGLKGLKHLSHGNLLNPEFSEIQVNGDWIISKKKNLNEVFLFHRNKIEAIHATTSEVETPFNFPFISVKRKGKWYVFDLQEKQFLNHKSKNVLSTHRNLLVINENNKSMVYNGNERLIQDEFNKVVIREDAQGTVIFAYKEGKEMLYDLSGKRIIP